ELPDRFLAQVEEGLGTKNLVADAMYRLTRRLFYDNISQDGVAMIVNDLITLGALPISVAMHLAVGDSGWFKNKRRYRNLVKGWKDACILACAKWGGGETPTLKDIILPGTFVLSGSAIGQAEPKTHLINPENIQDGDVILFVPSSGVHSNGLSLDRRIAEKLPQGYLTPVPGDGRTYGEVLLDPTIIYVRLMKALMENDIVPHSAINITGHGLRKLMRATQPFAYVVKKLPKLQPIFRFIQQNGPVDDYEAFSTFNMGVGFALILPRNQVSKSRRIATALGYPTLEAGSVEANTERLVEIRPQNITYRAKDLQLR
ncbi:MAG: AIR synthase-related protein, partial [Patescibacteria group bacterium]